MLKIKSAQTAFESISRISPSERQIDFIIKELEGLSYDADAVLKHFDRNPELAKKYAIDVKKGIGKILNDFFASEAGFRGKDEETTYERMSGEMTPKVPATEWLPERRRAIQREEMF